MKAINQNHWARILVALICSIGFVTIALTEPSQKWKLHPGTKMIEVEPSKGELSIEEMIANCETFLEVNRLPSPKGIIPDVRRSTFSGIRSRHSSIHFDMKYWFSVSTISGKIITFQYHERSDEILRGRKQTQPLFISDEAAALSYALKRAKQLGFNRNYVLDKFECDFSKSRKNAANIDARFVGQRHGYSLGSLDQGGIVIDPQDGALLSFGAPTDFGIKVESHTPRLTERQARSLADRVANRYDVGIYRRGYIYKVVGLKYGDRMKPSMKKSVMQYVLPNGKFGGLPYDARSNPRRVRLAWILWYPGDEAIWLDAADGRCLGGLSRLND